MGALVRVNGAIEKGQWRRWSLSMGVLNNGGSMGGIEKDEWGHWSLSMVALKRVNRGIGQGQWVVLKRFNGGVGQGQWGYWTMGAQWGVLKRMNGHWSGQWCRWSH